MGRFSQFWLQAKYESKKLLKAFYIFGYLLEPGIEIWRFFLNIG
jgi:hypothetical protein